MKTHRLIRGVLGDQDDTAIPMPRRRSDLEETPPGEGAHDILYIVLKSIKAVSYTHLTLPTTPYV